MSTEEPNTVDIETAAARAIEILEDNNLDVCLFGSLACTVYGMQHRAPNDVDLIVFDEGFSQADIKDILVYASPDEFYLVPSRNPNADYEVLWYKPLPEYSDSRWTCKVDILVPGLLSIPDLQPEDIVRLNGLEHLPVVPLIALLLLKLRGWTDHMDDNRRRMQEKTWVDEADLDEMLELALNDYGVHLDGASYLPDWFIEEGEERIERYVDACPDSARPWAELGFSVPEVDQESDNGYY